MYKLQSSMAIALTLASVVIISICIENALAGKKIYSGDDDYDESNEECDLGRNCKPGCYCADNECRPNNFPSKIQCHPYNYPQWKQWKKGSKHDGTNSTILVMVHYSNLTYPIETLLTNKNFTTYEILKPDTTLEQEPSALAFFEERFDLRNNTLPTSTPAFLTLNKNNSLNSIP